MNATIGGSRLLPWPELRQRIPYIRQHLARLEAAGQFPRRLRVGGRRVVWRESEIEDWIAARAGERDRPEAA